MDVPKESKWHNLEQREYQNYHHCDYTNYFPECILRVGVWSWPKYQVVFFGLFLFWSLNNRNRSSAWSTIDQPPDFSVSNLVSRVYPSKTDTIHLQSTRRGEEKIRSTGAGYQNLRSHPHRAAATVLPLASASLQKMGTPPSIPGIAPLWRQRGGHVAATWVLGSAGDAGSASVPPSATHDLARSDTQLSPASWNVIARSLVGKGTRLVAAMLCKNDDQEAGLQEMCKLGRLHVLILRYIDWAIAHKMGWFFLGFSYTSPVFSGTSGTQPKWRETEISVSLLVAATKWMTKKIENSVYSGSVSGFSVSAFFAQPEWRPLRASSLTVCSEWVQPKELFHYRNLLPIVKNYCCASQKEREKNILSSSHGTRKCMKPSENIPRFWSSIYKLMCLGLDVLFHLRK